MENEHFGIAVAELVRGGAIPFVHDSGGPVEVVGGRRELRFQDTVTGAAALSAVVRNPSLQLELRRFLAEHGKLFSPAEFRGSLRRIVEAGIHHG